MKHHDSEEDDRAQGTPLREWADEEIVMISALEHYSYCPRQCALIHLEQIFQENVFTLRGRHGHERADLPSTTAERGVRVERGLPLWSERYGLNGKADVVEFPPGGLPPVPVEYKHGGIRRGKAGRHEAIQLCAQALCLEEMFGVTVPAGAISSLSARRRQTVPFTEALREEAIAIIASVRRMLQRGGGPGRLPEAVNDARCPNCSLIDACMPATVVAARAARLKAALFVPILLERL